MIVLAVLRLLHFCFCFVNFDDILKPSHVSFDPFIIGFEQTIHAWKIKTQA
jgi:hypothetical protein